MNRRDLLALPATAVALNSYMVNQASIRQRTSPTRPSDAAGELSAADYGAVGDGTTDDTNALQRFLDAVSQTRQAGVIGPGTYRIAARLHVGSNSQLSMHGATLLCYDPALGSGGYNNDVPMMSITNADSVLIEGGTLDGRGSFFAETEFKAGIGIYGSNNVTLRDVTAVDCKGDGFHISLHSSGTTPPVGCKNVEMERCLADGNHRQGLSIISLEYGQFTDCNFTNTTGTNPQSGVDIEPNSPEEPVNNLRFERCSFDSNGGSGLIVSAIAGGELVQHSISVVDCTMNNNGVWGVWISNGCDLLFENCTINENGDTGFNVLLGANRQLTVKNCAVQSNGVHGLLLLGFGEYGFIETMNIHGCQIGSNGVSAPRSFSGIAFGHGYVPSVIHALSITDCLIGERDASNQLFGIMFGEAVEVTGEIVGNDFSHENSYAVYVTPSLGIKFRDNAGFPDRN